MVNKDMDKLIKEATEADDEMAKLNQEILDAMPMNAKHNDKVSSASRKLVDNLYNL